MTRKFNSAKGESVEVKETPKRPAPIVTDDSAVFWNAAQEGLLVAQQCRDCGVMRHPPRPMCPLCRSLEIDVVTLAGRGTVYSYAILHYPQNPAFDYPVLAALVDLDEGIRVVSNLIDVAPQDIHVGMRVEVCFVPTIDNGAVPVFRPIGENAKEMR
jgi:uncharacterized OB-fold protein